MSSAGVDVTGKTWRRAGGDLRTELGGSSGGGRRGSGAAGEGRPPGGAGVLGGQWSPGGCRWCGQLAWGGYLGPFQSCHRPFQVGLSPSHPPVWVPGARVLTCVHTCQHAHAVLTRGDPAWMHSCVLGAPVHIFLSPMPGLHPPAGVHHHPGASQEDPGGLLEAGVGAAGPHHRHADRGHGERAGEHTAAPGGHQVAGFARRPGCGSGRRTGTQIWHPDSQLDSPLLPLLFLQCPLLLPAQGQGWRRQGSLRLCFGHTSEPPVERCGPAR